MFDFESVRDRAEITLNFDPEEAMSKLDVLLLNFLGVDPDAETEENPPPADPGPDLPAWLDAPPLGHLRLIIFTEDITDARKYWASEMGTATSADDEVEGNIFGQVFTWGDGATAGTYSVVVVTLSAAMGLTIDLQLTNALLVHELAHVEMARMLKALIGPDYDEPVFPPDSYATMEHLAWTCWKEFHAETEAARYTDEDRRKDSEELLIRIVKTSDDALDRAAKAYSSTKDHEALSASLYLALFPLVGQFGRMFGIIDDEAALDETVLPALRAVDPFWAERAVKVYRHLVAIIETPRATWTRRTFEPLRLLMGTLAGRAGVMPLPGELRNYRVFHYPARAPLPAA